LKVRTDMDTDVYVDKPDIDITLHPHGNRELDDVIQRVEVDERVKRGVQIRRNRADAQTDMDQGAGHDDLGGDGKIRLANHLDVVANLKVDTNPAGDRVVRWRSVGSMVSAD